MTEEPTTLVIGLDGATWRLLDRWIDAGELPNLKRIQSASATATLRPCLPPVTCPNWKCYSTGKNPGKLGVFWWEIVDVDEPDIQLPDSRSFDSAELWDYLSEGGHEVAVINMPVTFPPHEVNGTMVARGSANDQAYTYPADVKEHIEREFDYKVNAERGVREEGLAAEIHQMIESRFDVLEWILNEKDPDFAHMTVFTINKLQHYFWDEPPTLEGWRIIDRRLSSFVDEGYDIIFTSDHGSNEIETTFQANKWLEQEGYLAREGTSNAVESVSRTVGINKRLISQVTARLGIREVIKRVVPRTVIGQLPTGASKVEKLDVIDWQRTRALASGQGLIYLTDHDSPRYDQIRDDIVAQLEALEDPSTGQPIARNVYLKEDIYWGDHLDKAPDIVFDQASGVHTEELVGDRAVFESPTGWSGENDTKGIFMAYGPSFDSTVDLDEVRIIDIMPTLLHFFGEPVPTDVDGTILGIFAPESDAARREPERRQPLSPPAKQDKRSRGTEERLRDLGYLP
jgi:predicted AlkP superfamily phosphohydrolase/phosphomutase